MMSSELEVSESHGPLERDGATVVPGVLGFAEVRQLLACMEALAAEERPLSRGVLYTHAPPPADAPPLNVLLDQWFNPHRIRGAGSTAPFVPALASVARRCLRRPAVLFQDLLLSKTPAHRPLAWHQDYPFWPVDRPEGMVIWLALDSVDAGNGAVEIAVGSHTAGCGPSIELHSGLPQPGTTGSPPELDAWPRWTPSLAPGDALVFDALTWHRSSANLDGRPRRAWATSWVSDAVRWSRANAPRHVEAARVVDGALVLETREPSQ